MHIQWRYLDIQTQPNTRLFDLELGRKTVVLKPRSSGITVSHLPLVYSIRIMRRCPVDSLALRFVRKSVFTMFCVVHPQGGNVARFRCEECGADYPYNGNPQPCANCAVERESGIRVVLGGWKWEKVWSV